MDWPPRSKLWDLNPTMKRSDQYWGKEMTAGPRDCGGGCSSAVGRKTTAFWLFLLLWDGGLLLLFCFVTVWLPPPPPWWQESGKPPHTHASRPSPAARHSWCGHGSSSFLRNAAKNPWCADLLYPCETQFAPSFYGLQFIHDKSLTLWSVN